MSATLKPVSAANPAVRTGACPIEQLIRRASRAKYTDEYNCKLFRLFPWPGNVETKRPLTEFGATWVILEPGRQVDLHDHEEEESFIGLSGEAELVIGSQRTNLGPGDVVFVPRSIPHSLINHSKAENFVFIDIYWDLGGPLQSS
jgi:mannose-6-phosphate isomerase-like protein (cupin superfamily)